MIPLLYFLIILFFTSCKTIQPPIWVKEFGVRTFSKDGIEGIGFVKFDKKDKSSLPLARQAAYNEAIKNLAVKLKTEVKGEIEHKMSDKITYVGKKFKQEAQDQINSLTDVLFNAVLGRKYFEEYIDYKNSLYWVYVWTTKAELNRAITEELEKQEMKNLAIMKTCIQQFKSAEEQIYRGNLILGLKLFSQILKNLSEVKGLSVVEKVDNISLEIDTRNKIDRIVSSFHITPIGRTNIETLRNTNIEIELNVECKYNYGDKTIVASGFPLKLNFIKGTGDGEKVKFTDNNGIAKFKLYQIDTEENIIEILPDIDSLPQEIPQLSDFSKVKAIYNIITRSQ
ncbi:MAG: hypothetical protein N2Z73_00925, partial [Endomicrobia bacterium]|nr:hypothetical protein [Endomicrobiia bacterium]